MSLKRRIIVKFLIENGKLVKYKQFTKHRRLAGNPLSTARIYEDYKLDEMMFCDVGKVDPGLLCDVTDSIFTPASAAGSIKTMAQVDTLIRTAGVDKVVVKDEDLGNAIALKYGRQAVVWAIDYKKKCVQDVPICAGEVLLTCIDRDGMGTGFDLEPLKRRWKIPVVLNGGCGTLFHVREAFQAGADGVAISSMFFFTDKSPIKLRSWLVSSGCEIRG
jgi:cyclase